jgi:hypothetical protein
MKGFLLRSIYVVLVINHANDGPSDHLRAIRISWSCSACEPTPTVVWNGRDGLLLK